MDLMREKSNSNFQMDTHVCPDYFAKAKPRQYNILNNLATCFPHGNLRDNVEIYVKCATGLFSVCESDGARWKCISKNEDALYQQLLQQKYREDCLAKLGVGKDVKEIPLWIQQLVLNQMRPKSKSKETQATIKTADIPVQATAETVEFGVQAEVETSDIPVQASVDMLDFGAQTKVTQMESGCQVDTVISTGESARSESSDVTLQVSLTKDGKLIGGIVKDEMNLELDKADQDILTEMINRNVAKKMARENTLSDVCAVPVKSPKSNPVGVDHTASRLGEGDSGMIGTSPFNNNRPMETSVSATRYQPRLPSFGYESYHISRSSPIHIFGYEDYPYDMPDEIYDVEIPVVETKQIIFQKGKDRMQLNILGQGSFGYVYMAKHAIYNLPICVKDYDLDVSCLHDIYHEAHILLYLQDTEYVPQCLGLMHSPVTPGCLALVQECYAGGCTLKNVIDDPPITFDKWKWITIVYNLFYGLNRIHQKHVLLNDIKTDNVLVDVRGDEFSNIRYIDFGLASFRSGHKFSSDNEYMATFAHMAPEVRRAEFSIPPSDVYSVGFIAYEICYRFGIRELKPIVTSAMHENVVRRGRCHDLLQKLETLLYSGND